MENKKFRSAAEQDNTTIEGCKKPSFFSALKALNSKRKKIWLTFTTALTMSMMSAVTVFAENSGGGGIDDSQGVDTFNSVIEFFATWIGRIGLVVAFVGGVMFALAIKNEDAEAKTRGLMTLASGFVVFALSLATGIFLNPSTAA